MFCTGDSLGVLGMEPEEFFFFFCLLKSFHVFGYEVSLKFTVTDISIEFRLSNFIFKYYYY